MCADAVNFIKHHFASIKTPKRTLLFFGENPSE